MILTIYLIIHILLIFATIRKKWGVDINERDRMIVATVIQWLGSNVGFSFLHETLKDFGYIIVEKK